MSKDLNPEKALIFRITHRDNVPWILSHGLHCRNSQNRNAFDPNYVEIGSPDLIQKRHHHPVQHAMGGTLGDYIPFYFTPFSPMLLNIKTGWNGIRQRPNDEIVILVSSLRQLDDLGVPFLFTDMHAYMSAARFFSNLDNLSEIDWDILQRRDFERDMNDLGKFDRYQAEALVRGSLGLDGLRGVICYNGDVESRIAAWVEEANSSLKIIVRPAWYF